MPFVSKQSVFPALKSLWHFQGSQLSSHCILRKSQEMRHRKQAPLMQRKLTPADGSECRSDAEPVPSESIRGNTAQQSGAPPGVPRSAACWPRGISREGLDSGHHLQQCHHAALKSDPAADGHKGTGASCLWNIHNVGTTWDIPQKTSVKHFENVNEVFLLLEVSYHCFGKKKKKSAQLNLPSLYWLHFYFPLPLLPDPSWAEEQIKINSFPQQKHLASSPFSQLGCSAGVFRTRALPSGFDSCYHRLCLAWRVLRSR